MPTPALYMRVSREEQVEGYSLDAQRRAIEGYCQARGWPPPTIYADEGVSAYTDITEDRPQFAAMLDAAVSGAHDVILVHKLDRFARSILVTLRELGRLERAGVAFVSLSEAMDFSTPIGRVVLSMLAAFAEFYSRNLSAEIKKGLHEKKRQGFHIGTTPYGSLRVGGVLSVDPAKADHLRTILALCARLPNQPVADELNRLGIPARRGGIWHGSAVQYFRTAAHWLASQGDGWASLAAAVGDRPRAVPVTRADTTYTLSGLLRCKCGGVIAYHLVTPTRRWGRCRNAANPARRGCTTWGRLEDLERQAEAWLFALPDPRATVALPDDPRPREDWELQRRRVLQLYRDGLMSEGEYQRERAALTRQAARLPVAAGRRETVGLGLARAREDWHRPEWGEVAKNQYYRTLVSHFVVDCGTLTPIYRPQYAGLFESGGEDEAW